MGHRYGSGCPVDPDCEALVCTDPQCGACQDHLEDHEQEA